MKEHLFNHFLPLHNGRGLQCFLRARTLGSAQPQSRKGGDFVSSLYLLVPGMGQRPILSSLQLGPILRVSLNHTLFILITAVRWIILQSDVLAPCPVPLSLWLIGAWLIPHSSANSISSIVKGGKNQTQKSFSTSLSCCSFYNSSLFLSPHAFVSPFTHWEYLFSFNLLLPSHPNKNK